MTVTRPLLRPIAPVVGAVLFLVMGSPLHGQAFGVRGETMWNTGRDLPATTGVGGWVQPWAVPGVFTAEWQRGEQASLRFLCPGDGPLDTCSSAWMDARVTLRSAGIGYRMALQSEGRWFLSIMPELGAAHVVSAATWRDTGSRGEHRALLARAGATLTFERQLVPHLPLRVGIGARATVAFRRRSEYSWTSYENGFSSAALQGGISYGVR